jgi:SAM-dependent methyltransferase
MRVELMQDIFKCKRDYLARMNDNKVHCMKVARRFDKDFFDGDRRYGYGGYKYDGRWKPLAQKLVDRYKLTKDSKVLDIGCGMGHLGWEIQQLTGGQVEGWEISEYAASKSLIKTDIIDIRTAGFSLDYDLIISINVLHNLILTDLEVALSSINRSSKHAYIVVESYRNEQELFNYVCWSLTGECFFRPEEWQFIFNILGCDKLDWEFLFLE